MIYETSMTTSMSSEAVWNYKKYVWTTENLNVGREIAFPCFYISAVCSLIDRQTNKIFIEYMLIY